MKKIIILKKGVLIILSLWLIYLLLLVLILAYDKITEQKECEILKDWETFCFDKRLIESQPSE